MLAAIVLVLTAAPADLVVLRGRIWTDGELTRATQFAVKDGRFVYVGGDASPWIGPHTTVLNARGKWVVPGLIDSHTHLAASGAQFKYDLDLRPAKSKDEFIRMVAEQCRRLPAGAWGKGYGWSVDSYPDKEPPSRAWLDAVTGDHPAVYHRMDEHSEVVNSTVLRAAGITAAGPSDPPGGRIERDPVTHEPTGLLTDGAMGLVAIPNPSSDEMRDGLLADIDEAHRWGVTASAEMSVTPPLLHAWQAYEASPDRAFQAALYFLGQGPRTIDLVKSVPEIPGWLEPRGIKLFMDGSMGSRSAWMAEPFTTPLSSQPAGWRGLPRPGVTNGTYRAIMDACAAANLQVAVHSIGDEANHVLLDMFAATPDIARRRFRVEHAQHLLPGDISRFGRLGVIASMQPYHKADDGRYCETVIGHARAMTSYAFADIRKSDGRLAFGSDFPVVTINPWVGMATAVTGKISTGQVWMPHENIPLNAALDAYTRGGAYAMFMEDELGRIRSGYHADFVILDRNPKPDGSDLAQVRPTEVYVEGRRVRIRP